MRSPLFLFQINTARTARAMENFTTTDSHRARKMAQAISVAQARGITKALPVNSPMDLSREEYTIVHSQFMKVLKTKIVKTCAILGKYWEICPIHKAKVPSLLGFIMRLVKLLRYQEEIFIPAMAKACSTTMWFERGAALTRLHAITKIWTEGLSKPLIETNYSKSCFD